MSDATAEAIRQSLMDQGVDLPPPSPHPHRIGGIRIRTQDEAVPVKETKKRLRACRRKFRIPGSTGPDGIFTCGRQDTHTYHEENGIVKDGSIMTEYTMEWHETPPKVLRERLPSG